MTPMSILDESIIRQLELPPTLYAEFLEQGSADDIDLFLTKVNQLPQNSQNKLLQDKILILNEKLRNVFEELKGVR